MHNENRTQISIDREPHCDQQDQNRKDSKSKNESEKNRVPAASYYAWSHVIGQHSTGDKKTNGNSAEPEHVPSGIH